MSKHTPARHGMDLAGDMVTFRLSGEVLAVPAAQLREVLEPVQTTRVPGAPQFVSGLVNVRGSVVPLADLRVPLRMPHPGGAEVSRDAADDARILVLELPLAGQASVVGVLADSVHEVTRLAPEALEEIPAVGTRWPPRYVAALGRWAGEFVTIPDLPAIFADFLAGEAGNSHRPGEAGNSHRPGAPAAGPHTDAEG
ncbi:chemotaxis protein CheW [Pseudoroseicyclus tamaricis]|uniref:Purine-binding chemotaxis protein CheW n=1 Tax=Pseudoroseicyclus tamaricis TaxID=2705421 RepID=A0A6B2JQB2_9RHOB|nr:chemotaxis protein CheW [Pseudoroseicyclus tamaricis]NDV00318.1 purine-binding chemotaxis protein CheW [Pseudoroseicyclus tamaricis]